MTIILVYVGLEYKAAPDRMLRKTIFVLIHLLTLIHFSLWNDINVEVKFIFYHLRLVLVVDSVYSKSTVKMNSVERIKLVESS